MDGSQLLLKTDFPEVRRGYDKAQVDSFLHSLGEKVGTLKHLVQQATERAEAAEAKLQVVAEERAVAEQARAEAEAALRASEAMRAELALTLDETRAQDGVDEVEVAAGVLSMAKRTADATVEEATQRARRLVEEAEVNAAVTQLEAEQRAERARRESEEQLSAMRRDQLDTIEAQARELGARRDALVAEVNELQAYVSVERARMREVAEALARSLGDGGPLELGPRRGLVAIEAGEAERERLAVRIPQLLEGPVPAGSLMAGMDLGAVDDTLAGPAREATGDDGRG